MKRPKLEINDFHAQFHNSDHYHHHQPGEHRLEWWELPSVREAHAFGGKTSSIVDRALKLTAKKHG